MRDDLFEYDTDGRLRMKPELEQFTLLIDREWDEGAMTWQHVEYEHDTELDRAEFWRLLRDLANSPDLTECSILFQIGRRPHTSDKA